MRTKVISSENLKMFTLKITIVALLWTYATCYVKWHIIP